MENKQYVLTNFDKATDSATDSISNISWHTQTKSLLPEKMYPPTLQHPLNFLFGTMWTPTYLKWWVSPLPEVPFHICDSSATQIAL